MTGKSHEQLIEAIFRISRVMKDSMSFDTELARLSMLQLQALVFLKHHEHAQMGEIANHFHIELPSATSLVAKLIDLKLVERQHDEVDRRIVRINLTAQGKKLLDTAMQERNKKIESALSLLSETDKKELLRIIEKMTTNMERMYE